MRLQTPSELRARQRFVVKRLSDRLKCEEDRLLRLVMAGFCDQKTIERKRRQIIRWRATIANIKAQDWATGIL